MDISKKEFEQYKEFLDNQLEMFEHKILFIKAEIKVLEHFINDNED